MSCVGPKSGMDGKYLSHSLTNKAKEKMKERFKENPAFKHLKMKPKAPAFKGPSQDADPNQMVAQGLA